MGLAILAAITAGLPLAKDIFEAIEDGIKSVNKAKAPGVKLTPDQAAQANANATKIAQVSLAAKVSTGKITQPQLDAALPDEPSLQKAVQMVYDAGPSMSPPAALTKNQLKAALLAVYMQEDTQP